jgi:hypothetical protein
MTKLRQFYRAIAFVHEDEDDFTLEIELMHDRAVTLVYSKTGEEPPRAVLWTGSGCHDFGNDTFECFEDWTKIAIGAMRPGQERYFLCQICEDQQGFGPMLRNEVWDAIAPKPRGMMCLDRMRIRTTAYLRRELANSDLTDCAWNAGRRLGQ